MSVKSKPVYGKDGRLIGFAIEIALDMGQATYSRDREESSLTPQERQMLASGYIGYCRSHKVAYLKSAMPTCPVGALKCDEHNVFCCDGSGKALYPSDSTRDFLELPCNEWRDYA